MSTSFYVDTSFTTDDQQESAWFIDRLPYIAMYGATKAFVLNFTEALAAEYRNSGVRFMALCPGNTLTNFAKVANANTTGMPGATPEYVVTSALRAFSKGDAYHVPGLTNYLTTLLQRWFRESGHRVK